MTRRDHPKSSPTGPSRRLTSRSAYLLLRNGKTRLVIVTALVLVLGIAFSLVVFTTLRAPIRGDANANAWGPEGIRPRLRELTAPSVADTVAAVDFVTVGVFYGTDRARTGRKEPGRFFGPQRGSLQFGHATVSIPKRGRPGDLSGPRWYLAEFKPDPAKHVILQRVQPLPRPGWLAMLDSALDTTANREALVVVHGFREQFEHATRRTAQLAYDLNFHGVPVVYSWPTKGTLKGYLADEATAQWTVPHLRDFLNTLVLDAGVNHVYVLAHSMGSRVVAGAVGLMESPGATSRLDHIILAAPDVDAQTFTDQDAPRLWRKAGRLTLYASSRDRALNLSRNLHGDYRRAGDGVKPLVVLDSMDTIDASTVDTDLIGHGYYSENKSVIDDLFMIIEHNLSAARRNLRIEPQGAMSYYILR